MERSDQNSPKDCASSVSGGGRAAFLRVQLVGSDRPGRSKVEQAVPGVGASSQPVNKHQALVKLDMVQDIM